MSTQYVFVDAFSVHRFPLPSDAFEPFDRIKVLVLA
jgi:hypothetical protein